MGEGSTINAWFDPWLSDKANFKIDTTIIPELSNMMVKNLMIHGCLQWDVKLLNELISPRDMAAILSIPRCPIIDVDHCIWHYSKFGEYTVRSAYRLSWKGYLLILISMSMVIGIGCGNSEFLLWLKILSGKL